MFCNFRILVLRRARCAACPHANVIWADIYTFRFAHVAKVIHVLRTLAIDRRTLVKPTRLRMFIAHWKTILPRCYFGVENVVAASVCRCRLRGDVTFLSLWPRLSMVGFCRFQLDGAV